MTGSASVPTVSGGTTTTTTAPTTDASATTKPSSVATAGDVVASEESAASDASVVAVVSGMEEPNIPLLPSSDQLVLEPIGRIQGDLAPKSIVASGTGLYFAQNMMYRHTVSVFDDDRRLVKTIDDAVDLAGFGYDVAGDVYRGAPVEASFTSDGSYAFVSNYRMYGPGYDPEAGSDDCERDDGQDSFVYRINTASLEIDRVYPVGKVPKFLAVTPNDRYLLVSNWCGFDVTVVDLTTHATVAEIGVGRYPRGIAVTGDSRTAYVALMGSTDVAVISLPGLPRRFATRTSGPPRLRANLAGVGVAPRHLVLSPDDRLLYVTLSGEDAVVAVDVATGDVTRRAKTGHRPRSMDISDDGTALYVVNHGSATMTKIRTSDFAVLQQIPTADLPIGITYDSLNGEVWVSTYSGVIHVYTEVEPHR